MTRGGSNRIGRLRYTHGRCNIGCNSYLTIHIAGSIPYPTSTCAVTSVHPRATKNPISKSVVIGSSSQCGIECSRILIIIVRLNIPSCSRPIDPSAGIGIGGMVSKLRLHIGVGPCSFGQCRRINTAKNIVSSVGTNTPRCWELQVGIGNLSYCQSTCSRSLRTRSCRGDCIIEYSSCRWCS